MDRTCGMYVRHERVHTGFWWGDLRKRGRFADTGVY